MKNLTTLILLLTSLNTYAFDHNVVVGQWAVYQNGMYYFLNINENMSGTLVRSLGHDPIERRFKPDSVIERDGYLEIELIAGEKAVLSAWKLPSGSGRRSGQIYMYKDSGELFNMLHFPLHLLNQEHEFMSYEPIKNLSQTHH